MSFVWSLLFVLSCHAELVIFAGWLVTRLFKRNRERYPFSVLRLYVMAISLHLIALAKWFGFNLIVVSRNRMDPLLPV